MPLVHHEQCFGCGRTNLFGLLLEAELVGPGTVVGRCFIKQDHQGQQRGRAHDGIVATALAEAMAFACGDGSRAQTLEVTLQGSAPVGAYLDIEAWTEPGEGAVTRAAASATSEGVQVARATGTFRS